MSYSQMPDSNKSILKSGKILTAASPRAYKPEIFTNGFIDVINNGQVNAAARLVRIYIGEPGKFTLPLSIFSGVSANNFQNLSTNNPKTNEGLVINFINPTSGLGNICFDGTLFRKKDSAKITKFGIVYSFGERVLTGKKVGLISDPEVGQPINFLNSYSVVGLYFQTGAWDRNNIKNLGACWIAFRYIACYTNPSKIQEMIPIDKTNGVYHGYSIAWGIEISQSLNTRVILYKYRKKPEIQYYLPIYQFSFNYTLKK